MRSTDDPVAFTFSHPPAKRILYLVHEGGSMTHEEIRRRTGLHPVTFQRLLRRLAQFDLVAIRAPKDAEFENHRIRVVLGPTPRGQRLVALLRKLDGVLRENPGLVAPESRRRLLSA